jgi:WD40 repeat protein
MGSFNRTATIIDAYAGNILASFPGHTHAVKSVAFSSDGSLIASVPRDDGTIRIWQSYLGNTIPDYPRAHGTSCEINNLNV